MKLAGDPRPEDVVCLHVIVCIVPATEVREIFSDICESERKAALKVDHSGPFSRRAEGNHTPANSMALESHGGALWICSRTSATESATVHMAACCSFMNRSAMARSSRATQGSK